MAAVIMTLMVLGAGCVRSQSTTDDSETPLRDLGQQMAELQQQHLQVLEMLRRVLDQQQQLLEHQQQQRNELDEYQASVANNPGMYR